MTKRVYGDFFTFTDHLRRSGRIFLRLYELGAGSYLAIATDLNDGPSVTNAAESIAMQVRQHFGLQQGDALLWVEHYRQRRDPDPEEYDKVFMRWNGQRYVDAEWKYSNKAQIEALLGLVLDEVLPLKEDSDA